MLTKQSYDPAGSVPNGTHPLIALTFDQQGNQAVSARVLHAFLSIKRDFTTWCKQMFDYGFVEGEDYWTMYVTKSGDVDSQAFKYTATKRSSMGISTDYLLTLDCGKEIAMVQRTAKGRQARRYFITCEKALKDVTCQSPTVSALVNLVNDLTDRVIGLEGKLDRVRKSQEKYFEAQVLMQKSKEQIELSHRRERIMGMISMFVRKSHTASWTDFWNAFAKTYGVDPRTLSSRPGEHPLDVAIRHGYIDKVTDMINWQ